MRFACRGLLTVGLLTVFVGICLAALTPGQKMAARDLIKQLSSEEFKVRESAVEKLAALGPDVIPLIKPMLESDDEELKLRAGMILKRIGQKHPDAAGTLVPEVGEFDRRTGSLITLKLANADLATVLEGIAQQTGNKALALPQDWKGKPITVDFDKTPYWKAIDQLCKMEGLMYQPDWRERALQLVPAEDVTEITSYAGPLVLKIISARKNRSYRSVRKDNRLACNVQVFWEDRLSPGWHEPVEVGKVTDQTGAELKVDQPGARGARRAGMRGGMAWQFGRARGMRGGMPMSSFQVTVPDYPENLTRLSEISGKLTTAFATGTQEIIIEDVLVAGDKSGRVGGYELKVTDVQHRRQYVLVTATLTAEGKPAERMNYGSDQLYGVWLVDMDGKKYRGYVGAGVRYGRRAGGRGQVIVAGAGAGAGAGNRAEADGSRRITFRRIPEEMDVFRLVYVFPAKVTEQVYDFKFTEVPVP